MMVYLIILKKLSGVKDNMIDLFLIILFTFLAFIVGLMIGLIIDLLIYRDDKVENNKNP